MFDKTRSKKLIVQQLDLLFKVDFDAIKISVLPKLLITMKCLNYADYISLMFLNISMFRFYQITYFYKEEMDN